MQSKKIIVRGIVQGVGFRPFIYRLAQQYGITGIVSNNAYGVEIEAEGEHASIQSFIHSINHSPPPLALIDRIETSEIACKGYMDFQIRPSNGSNDQFTLISPDVTVCGDCLTELSDPNDRRYRYPFINCTNCGPRFTIIQDIPYDRPNTTMSVFPMCGHCEREYHDPSNRRFHAQPNACPVCGPEIMLLDNNKIQIETDDAIRKSVSFLTAGKIVAIKGLGGYHLACDATNEKAVRTLRDRKRRIEKPFAVMIPGIEWIDRICTPTEQERSFIESINHPIVLIQRKEDSPISTGVAPGNNYIGVMLPYTPLHHILLSDAGMPLVMTSGNICEEPIAYKDDDAFKRLGTIADYFLIHNREIYMRCDDSVGAVLNNRNTMLRRSRGYVPYPVKLNIHTNQPVLAVGGHLKNTFCFLKNDFAFISHHIGDLENYETFGSFTEGIEHFKNLYNINPEILAYDMHPEYLSTKYALESSIPVKIPVQHHHAHIVSCMAENNIYDDVIGISFDGTGYGPDGTIWGGEFITATPKNFNRIAHFDHIPLPGGERAIKEPWRLGVALLFETFGTGYTDLEIPFIRSMHTKRELPLIEKMIRQKLNTPVTSAAGRLFDGIAALCGIRNIINYEAQAAIELQMLADEKTTEHYDYDIDTSRIPRKIKWQGIVKQIVKDITRGIPVSEISDKFHNTIARIISDIAGTIRKETGLQKIVLSGGVFQNALLLDKSVSLLTTGGFQVFTHSRVPPNDGGLSLGQAVIAVNKFAL
jgi:hydrogenase maturation protein HypF